MRTLLIASAAFLLALPASAQTMKDFVQPNIIRNPERGWLEVFVYQCDVVIRQRMVALGLAGAPLTINGKPVTAAEYRQASLPVCLKELLEPPEPLPRETRD